MDGIANITVAEDFHPDTSQVELYKGMTKRNLWSFHPSMDDEQWMNMLAVLGSVAYGSFQNE